MWKDLVGTGKRYDFKNDTRTMKGPVSPNCPRDCLNTITLCAGSGLFIPSLFNPFTDCFQTDVPGNLFYAHVGRFVGWTELALQAGSQFAQLESTRSWDPPEDTRMINIGFALPDPLSRTDFCSSIVSNKSIFTPHQCKNCAELTTVNVV